jgi:hypothetical protein
LEFAKKNLTRGWRSVMFTDRKKFLLRYPGQGFRGTEWKRVGDFRVANKVNNPSAYNVYAGITAFGVTEVAVVAGTTSHKSLYLNQKGQPSKNITKAEYTDVLQKHLLPAGNRIFRSQGISTWTFQQDNDPSHRCAAEVVAEWNERHNSSIQLLPNWPPNSPDLNPIENFWGWVQAKVDRLGCKTISEFKLAVNAAIKEVPKDILSNYFSSMKRRMQKNIELGGGKTKY